MKHGKFKRTATLASMVFLLTIPTVSFANDKEIVLDIGIIFRLEDKFNKSVGELTTGIQTAKALFEQKHPNTKIILHRFSHTDELASVVAAADRAIAEKVSAVIGGELSEESFVLRDKLGPKKIVFMTPTSSNPLVTEGHPFSFRACFSDRLVAVQLANFTISRLKPRAVGIIRNISSPYTDFLSKQYSESLANTASENGEKIPIYEEKVLRDTPDFTTQIQNFIDHKVTHVAMLSHQSDLLRFALQASKRGYFPVYIGSDGWGSNESVLQKLVTETHNHSRFIGFRNSYWKEDTKSGITLEFQKKYKQLFSQDPNAWSAVAFDGTWTLLTAMANAGNHPKGETIRNELLKIKNIPLVTTDHFYFGSDNSPKKDLFVYRIDLKGVDYVETLK